MTMTTALKKYITNQVLARKRQKWLKGRDLTIRHFTTKINEGHSGADIIEANVTTRWITYGRQPEERNLERVLKVFPDWPH